MKHLFIINPAAGSRNRTDDYSEVIHKVCRARKLNYEVRVSTAPGECNRIAREAAQTGEELRIYACGGDGTLNEVVAGAAGYPNAAVTVYSGRVTVWKGSRTVTDTLLGMPQTRCSSSAVWDEQNISRTGARISWAKEP